MNLDPPPSIVELIKGNLKADSIWKKWFNNLYEWLKENVSKDYFTEVAAGNINGSSIMSAMGERESMGTTADGEDIWRGNELSPAPTSTTTIPIPDSVGEQMTVVSESANDTIAGTGARTVSVHYLDANGDDQVEIVEMDGTTPINTVATDIRFVNDFHVQSAGTGLVTSGHIKIYKTGSSGLVYNMIAVGGNKSLVPNRMIPSGKKLILKGWHASEAKGKRVAFRIRSTDIHGDTIPGIFLFKDATYLNNESSGQLTCHVLVPALSIVKISGWPDVSGGEGSCSWWGELRNN